MLGEFLGFHKGRCAMTLWMNVPFGSMVEATLEEVEDLMITPHYISRKGKDGFPIRMPIRSLERVMPCEEGGTTGHMWLSSDDIDAIEEFMEAEFPEIHEYRRRKHQRVIR